MNRVVILIQCRLASSRLPRKALIDIEGRPLLNQLYRRMQASKQAWGVWVCCPDSDVLEIEQATRLPVIGGPEKDILTRLLGTAEKLGADRFVRVTGDNPLSDPMMIDHMIKLSVIQDIPVVTNWRPRLYPDGVDAEVYSVSHLKAISRDLKDEGDREWFASYCAEKLPADWVQGLKNNEDLSRFRLTVDYPEDLEVVRAIFKEMGNQLWDTNLIVRWLEQNPKVKKLNQHRVTDFGARPCL